jgi:hypothetical protein
MSNGERKISSLRDLPRDIPPARDLWQGIEARIAAERKERPGGALAQSRSRRGAALKVLAAVGVLAALAVGIWIGRAVLPAPGKRPMPDTHLTASNTAEPGAFHAAYVMDPKYTEQRAALVHDLEARMAALPPDSRAKVMSSLQAINDSKRALEEALGKDPSNALLQELLVNTYQDEMRVLTAVHEAGKPGEGI